MNTSHHATEKTVGIGWVQAIVAAARRGGAESEPLLARAGIASLPNDPLGRVPLDAVVRLWRASADLTGDMAFGLHMGQSIEPTSFNVVAYTLVSSTTLREAFVHLQRFQRLVSDGARLQLVEQNGQAWVVYHPMQERLSFAPMQTEAVLTCAVRLLRWIMGAAFTPERVCVTHAAISPPAVYQIVLGCAVEFLSPFNGIGLPPEWLDSLLPARNPELCRLHESLARQHLASLEQSASFKTRVDAVLRQMLAQGMVHKEPVATLLGLSARTLQLRLSQEGTSFAATLDAVRHAMALEYLDDPMLSLGQIAVLRHFSDASAFYRAFKRWTGRVPGEYRRDHDWV
jgi:AraC-like DNA-binding protein